MKTLSELATEYQDEIFKISPGGFTVAPYCNSETIAEAYEAGASKMAEIKDAEIAELKLDLDISRGAYADVERRYSQACKDVDSQRFRANEYLEEISRLRLALEFYADENKWTPRHHALSGINPEADIDGENGKCAREALTPTQKVEGENGK